MSCVLNLCRVANNKLQWFTGLALNGVVKKHGCQTRKSMDVPALADDNNSERQHASCWLAYFSTAYFTFSFMSRVATNPIAVSLWLRSCIIGVIYWHTCNRSIRHCHKCNYTKDFHLGRGES